MGLAKASKPPVRMLCILSSVPLSQSQLFSCWKQTENQKSTNIHRSFLAITWPFTFATHPSGQGAGESLAGLWGYLAFPDRLPFRVPEKNCRDSK